MARMNGPMVATAKLVLANTDNQSRSDWDNVDQVAEVIKVAGVASVEPGGMSVGGRRYQQVHRSCSRLTSRVNRGRRHLPIARRHGNIHRQRVEFTLDDQQAPQCSFATSTPRCSSANVIALMANSPSRSSTSVAMTTLVSRIALTVLSTGLVFPGRLPHGWHSTRDLRDLRTVRTRRPSTSKRGRPPERVVPRGGRPR